MDSSTDGRGTLTSKESITCVVWGKHSITLESGAIRNTSKEGTTIFNLGTFTMNGGVISGDTVVYNTAKTMMTLLKETSYATSAVGKSKLELGVLLRWGKGLMRMALPTMTK